MAAPRTLDSRFTNAQWSALTLDEALDAVEKIVRQPSNQVVMWSKFFKVVQEPSEPISAYFARCSQKAVDCGFQCPRCDGDPSEYFYYVSLLWVCMTRC